MIQTVAEVALWLGFAAATPFVVLATMFLAITQGRWALGYLIAALAIAIGWFALAVVLIRRTDPSGETMLLVIAAVIALFALRRFRRRFLESFRRPRPAVEPPASSHTKRPPQ